MINRINISKKFSFNRSHLTWVFLALILVYIIFEGGHKTLENYRLKRKGICVKAIVLEKNHVGAKGVIYTHYQYIAKGVVYQGISSSDDNANIGDSIVIVYLDSDPDINRSNGLLKINCRNYR